ncbi:MAG: PD40 domain-containing protein [Bacteroidales bacterium]|nr:PD40 domain-containing protein [Bacteroidales bacterium]
MKKPIFSVLIFLMVASCRINTPEPFMVTHERVSINPDYTNLTIPKNIAPLNFTIDHEANGYITKVFAKKGKAFTIQGKNVLFRKKKWEEFLSQNTGDTIFFQLFLKKGNNWLKYPVIRNYVANEPIDNYLSYRLIQPLFNIYDRISIHQRDLTCFSEKILYNNRIVSTATRGQCVNCHSFQDYNRTGKMQMHFRGYLAGTLITKDKKLEKFNLKTRSTISGGVYPAWHPSLNLIAYSVNSTGQAFHTKDLQKTEVIDKESDLILYNLEKNEVMKIADDPNYLETFPYWAPDGKSLYYASAEYNPDPENLEQDILHNYKNIKYDLIKISFNTQTLEFGETDTVFKASAMGKSATFPRLSPDGTYLMFTLADFGNFHIWHKTSDLYLKNMETGEFRDIKEINSNDTESYHSWSSNGNWVVFSSRRQDGGYTRFYISYFNGKGYFSKPFVLPQKDPQFYGQFFKSFNVPEFMVNPVDYSPRDFYEAIKSTSIEVDFAE